jgi:hypothetical protein
MPKRYETRKPETARPGKDKRSATQARKGDSLAAERDKAHLDELLDEALRETFPGSDPIAPIDFR